MNKISIAAMLASAAVSFSATAQSFIPVPAVKIPDAGVGTESIRVINITAEKSWANVGENERVKFIVDGTEQIVNFGQPGAEKIDIGGKQIVVYVGGMSQFSSPGE